MTAAFANGLAEVISVILTIIQILIIASVLVSWVNADPNNPIVQLIYRTTEPIYRPFRKFTKKIPGPFDWAPVFVLLVIIFLQQSVVYYLKQYARTALMQ